MYGSSYYSQGYVADYPSPPLYPQEWLTTSTAERYELSSVEAGYQWVKVNTNLVYNNPVIIAGISSYNDSTPAVVVVRNVKPNEFEVRVVEPPNEDDNHAIETIAYGVFESGVGSLSGIGARYEAGISTVSDVLNNGGTWQNVSGSNIIGEMVLTQITVNDFEESEFCKSKGRFSGTNAQVTLQNAQGDTTPRPSTKVHWLKINYFFSPKHQVEAGRTHITVLAEEFITQTPSVTNSWYEHAFLNESFTEAPRVISRILGMSDTDPVEARLQDITTTTVDFKSEEDQNYDSEQTHSAETVCYLAFQDDIIFENIKPQRIRQDWGLKISLPGYSVWDATDNQIVFSSEYNIAKTILGISGFAYSGQYSWGTYNFPHNQPSAPAFLTYIEVGNDLWVRGTPIDAFGMMGGFNPFSIERSAASYVTDNNFVLENPPKRAMFLVYLERTT